MKNNLCKWPESCNEERVNYPNKSIKSPYCRDHLISFTLNKVRRQLKSEQKKKVKEEKQSFVHKKEESRSKSYFEKLLQTEINSIVRLIDSDKGCISCNHGWDKPWSRQKNSGHKFSVGSNPSLRYNLFDIFVQCTICNNWKSGNEREYDKGLIAHYGAEMLDYIHKLPSIYKELHLSIEELKQAIINARLVKSEILSGNDYTREEINFKIGIYK